MNRAAAPPIPSTELVLIRHAPASAQGRVTGRRDVAIAPCDVAALSRLRTVIGPLDRLVSSPARRCLETARLLFDRREPRQDARLWEQDFGDWEGRPYAELPDIGVLGPDDLARHRPPGGECFAEVCERVAPVIRGIASDGAGRVGIVAHAGSIRAALASALGTTPGTALAFEIAPLSLTLVRAMADGSFAVAYVNRVA